MDFPPVYGTENENQLLRAQQNQEGDTDTRFTVKVHLFLEKNAMSLFIRNLVFYDVCSSTTHGATHTSTKVIHSRTTYIPRMYLS